MKLIAPRSDSVAMRRVAFWVCMRVDKTGSAALIGFRLNSNAALPLKNIILLCRRLCPDFFGGRRHACAFKAATCRGSPNLAQIQSAKSVETFFETSALA